MGEFDLRSGLSDRFAQTMALPQPFESASGVRHLQCLAPGMSMSSTEMKTAGPGRQILFRAEVALGRLCRRVAQQQLDLL
jgi:hypothetical protein